MYDENDLKLHDLKVANTKEISDIYDINQGLIPDVGSLKDIGTLKTVSYTHLTLPTKRIV